MSLEQKIEVLTAAVVALTAALQNQQGATAVVPQVVPQAAPVPQAPVPAAPAFVPPAAPAPAAAMPPAPSFIPQAAPPATLAPRPFNDPTGLIEYVTAAYTALGAEKGAGIGNILSQLGVGNVNDVQPAQYDTLYAGIEVLKTV